MLDHIAYRSERDDGGIYLAATFGGQEPRLLVSGGRRPMFSPDGRLIAYWTGSNIGFARNTGSYRTFVIPVSGGAATEIKGFTGARYPVWAPDGHSLLLLGSRDANPLEATYDWWRVPIDGTAPTRLGVRQIMQRAGVAFASGDIGPEDWRGDRIVFSDNSYLWSLLIDPRTMTPRSVERLTFGTARDVQPTTAGSGLLAFTSAKASNSVWALPIDANRGTVTGPPSRVTGGTGFSTRPSPTTDARVVAYWTTPPVPTILVKDRDDNTVRDIGIAGSPFGPALAPDGGLVAYEAAEGVSVVSTRGGAPRVLCTPCSIGAWAADSRALMVVKAGNNAGRLTWIDVARGDTRDVIISPDHTVNRPFPSPDGRLLAFRQRVADGDAIMIAPVPTNGSAPRDTWIELVTPERDARPVGWSPDGTLLYFVSERDGTRCLYAQRIDRSRGAAAGRPMSVQHFHGSRNVFRGSLGSVLSTGPGNAISLGFFFYDLSSLSANVWTLRRE